MKKIMLILAALVAMVSFSSCDRTVSKDVNVYVIEELRETEDKYILQFRETDTVRVVNKKHDLRQGMIILINKEESANCEIITPLHRAVYVNLAILVCLIGCVVGVILGAKSRK